MQLAWPYPNKDLDANTKFVPVDDAHKLSEELDTFLIQFYCH
jgi:hypothetical protein